jgi:hypothetical protein
METRTPTRPFPDTLRLRLPRGFLAAVATAARRRHTTSAEWSRQALLSRLSEEGIVIADEASQVIGTEQ